MSTGATRGTSAIDADDPRWFVADLDVASGMAAFVTIDEAVIERSSFLDTRIETDLTRARVAALAELSMPAVPQPVGWLFHSSFCGSTLLARVLHAPPHSTCLREPLVLRRLGDARHAGTDVSVPLQAMARLLSRPWHEGGVTVIKPTHAALNIAPDLLDATPGSRGVLLTSTLEDFLVSNIKKTAESQAKVPALAERAMGASGLHLRLPASAMSPPDLLCAVALQWAAQREVGARLVAHDGGGRVRWVRMESMLGDLAGTAVDVARWIGIDAPGSLLAERCRVEGARNAKAPGSSYGADRRADEVRQLRTRYEAPIESAMEWARRHVVPYMSPQALEAPETWKRA